MAKDASIKNLPLYQSKEKVITYRQIRQSLKKLGVARNDVLFVHSDISTIGRLLCFDRVKLLSGVATALTDAVGDNGTVIMPTFTYSFCKKEIFDPEQSPSTVGALTEFFRHMPGVKRTQHALFSVAVWGKNQDYFSQIDHDSFSNNSTFAKLLRKKGKIVFFGLPSLKAATFVHYVEQQFGVRYRFIKKFKGIIHDRTGDQQQTFTFFVRYLSRRVEQDMSHFEQHMQKLKLWHRTLLGDSMITLINADDFYCEAIKMLKRDSFYFLKHKPYLNGKA